MSFTQSVHHHWQVAREAYRVQREEELGRTDRPGRQELQFMPAVLEVTETPASPIGRALALAIVIFFNIALTWAVVGEVDIIATAAGKIIPAARVKLVQPAETGVIKAIHVRDGDEVTAGQVLIELDPTEVAAEQERLAAELASKRVEAARLEASLEKEPEKSYSPPPGTSEALVELHRTYLLSETGGHLARMAALDSEIRRQKAEVATIDAEIKRLKTILPNVRERVEKRMDLVRKGATARLQYLELEEELMDKEGELMVQRRKRQEAVATLAAKRDERRRVEAEFRSGVLAGLAEARERIASLEKELVKADERLRLATLRAPVDGTVQQLEVHTVGGVVTPAQELLVVVPADTGLEVEVDVLNKDIGFVRAGHPVEIKVDAFPFTKYGTIDGEILNVSGDAVENEQKGWVYPSRVSMAETQILSGDKWIDLSPGMSVQAEIKTGKRKVIEYLLAPLQEYQEESMRER